MSILLTRVHSILNLEYLQKAFSENFLRMLESSGRLVVLGYNWEYGIWISLLCS